MKRACVILGGGGHAHVVVDAVRREGRFRPAAVTDPRRGGEKILRVPVVGGDEVLPGLRRRGIRHFVVGLAGVPDNRPRARLFQRAVGTGLAPLTVVHPAAAVGEGAELGPGTVVLAQAAVNPRARLGRNVIVNTGAVVEHDARIADHVHVCPGAVLAGSVEVGEGAFVGAGAVVRQGVRIGAWAVVGAGAVVLKDVAEGAVVAGVPARPIRGKKR